MDMSKETLADYIHEYNDACHVNVPIGKHCSRCLRLARQVLFFIGNEMTTESVKQVKEKV